MNYLSNVAESVADNALLVAMQKSKTASSAAYTSIKTAPTIGPFIPLFCITYNSILLPENKTLLDQFIKDNFPKYYTKYKILTTLCLNETNGERILGLIKLQLANEPIKSLLPAIGLSVETIKTSTIDSLRREINVRFPKVLDYINTKKSELENAFTTIDINKLKQLATTSYGTSKPVGGKSRKSKKRSNKTKNVKQSSSKTKSRKNKSSHRK